MQSINIRKCEKRFLKTILFFLVFNSFFLQTSFAQCAEPDASIWLNTWVSCEQQNNPIPAYGPGHWIQYDFGAVRTLSKTWIWNTNDPSRLNQGFKRVKIDYSENGLTWNHWGEMTFPKGRGNAVYGGFPGPDLVNIKARYVLLTALSNYGADCTGLAEVKFNLLPEIVESPDQFTCETAKPISRIFTEFLGATEAFIYWKNDIPEAIKTEVEYFLEIRPLGTENWFELESEGEEIFLEELKPNTTYEYRIIFACEEEALPSSIKQFTTLSDLASDTKHQSRIEERMQVVPNPTKADFTIDYFSPRGSQLHYSVKDLQGKTLLQFHVKAEAGSNRFPISLDQFPDGVYLVHAFAEGQTSNLVERVVKIGN